MIFEFWFMFPIAILIAIIAMIMGVGGALFFSPIFIFIFPVIGVSEIAPAEAIGAALITELFGFGSGLIGYSRKGFIDLKTGSKLLVISLPLSIIGSIVKHRINSEIVILAFATGLWIMGVYTLRTIKNEKLYIIDKTGIKRELTDKDGNSYVYEVCNQTSGRLITGIGGFFTGLISVGIGETAVSTLRSRCGLPMKIASGTSVFVVTLVVLTASITEIVVQGFGGIPWNLILFTAPGVLIGGQLGPKLASKINERKAEKFLIIMFFIIGTIMGILGIQQIGLF